jgi:hypothetical protein
MKLSLYLDVWLACDTSCHARSSFSTQEMQIVAHSLPYKALFGTRVLVGISGDNPHQTPNPHALLKICLVLEYWASLIPTFPQILVYFSQSPILYLYLVDCGWGFVGIG